MLRIEHHLWQMIQCVVYKMSDTKAATMSAGGALASVTAAFSVSDLALWMQVIVLFFAIVAGAGSATLAWLKVFWHRKERD
jgi:hypothetical protein